MQDDSSTRRSASPPWRGVLGVMIVALMVLPSAMSAQRIDSVTLNTQSVFDQSDSSLVARVVNFFHTRTRPAFIRRELLFHPGDQYDSAAVAETERNLRALGVFRDVSIDTTTAGAGAINVTVTTRDAFTLQVQPSFKLNAGSAGYSLTLVESNLFGTITQVEASFRHDPDRNTYLLGLARRRLINGRIGGVMQLYNRSDGRLFLAQLSQPYFTVASPVAATATFDDHRYRIFRYRDGERVPGDTLQGRFVLGRVDLGRALHATPRGYLRLGFAIQGRREDYIGNAAYQNRGFPISSVTGAVGVSLQASHIDQPTVVAFQSMSRKETIDLSRRVELSLFAAPRALGYEHGHAGLAPGIALHGGFQFVKGGGKGGGRGFAYADVSASGLFTGTGLDSGQVYMGVTAAFHPGPDHQILAHLEASALRDPVPGTEFDLGYGDGPRAFAVHSFTGDREYFASVEYRYTVARNVLKVADLGVAAFADAGGAWWAGDPRRGGYDIGIGLRANFPRAADLNTNRIDIAWRGPHDGLPGGWAIAVAKGFSFASGLRGGALKP